MPIAGTERYFPFVTFPYPYPIVGVSEVDFRKDDRVIKPIEKLVNKREWVMVFNREGI